MTDVLGTLKGTLDPATNKVKKDSFKTKIEEKIKKFAGTPAIPATATTPAIAATPPGTADEQAQAVILDAILKQDTFSKMDLNGDGDISEDELNRSGNIDGKPEFTMEDVRALKRRPAVRTVTDESKLDNIPLPLRLGMRPLNINNGGYIQSDSLKSIDVPGKTSILPPLEIKEQDPTDPTKTIVNNFTLFVGVDNNLYITGYENDYKVTPGGKDTTSLFEYIIPLDELLTFAAFNPKERVWIRVPGKYSNEPQFATIQGEDIVKLPQIDLSKAEGRTKLAEYIKKHLLLNSTGKLDFSKLQHFKDAKYHEGIGAKGLRESELQAAN